jgi:AcrR family transcriptional regulator
LRVSPARLEIKIAELVRISRTPRSTIHHYANLGLLPRPLTRGPKLHLYGQEHLARLSEIKRLRAQGLSLSAIKPLLSRTTPRTRPARADAPARARILQRATQRFLQLGYARTRLDDLAAELEIAKATIYRHFPNKQALFVACVESIRYALIPQAAREQSAQQPDLDAHGRDRARAVLENFASYRGLTALLGAMVVDPDRALAARAQAELHGMITNAEPFLRKLRTLGQIRAIDTELLAYMLWGALMGAGERLALDDRYTLEEVLAAYLDFIARGTRATDAP